MEKRVAFCVLKALVAAYIVTGLLLLILAFALYKLGLSENVVELGVVSICCRVPSADSSSVNAWK